LFLIRNGSGSRSLLTRQKAVEHCKPVIHLDMDKLSVPEAIGLLKEFVANNDIDILNVAGSRASKDSEIYGKTFEVVGGI
jgi:hypothetical protein